jgi:uncharacterized protein (DUF2336 family)
MGDTERSDLEGMLALARDKSVEARTRLVEMVGDLYFDAERGTTRQERALMCDILRRLVQDVEMAVRRALAERLAEAPTAPRELVTVLANDQIEVARPILLVSRALQDPDLIEVIQQRTLEHQLAVAQRSTISSAVSDALVETGHVDVITALLNNHGAEIEAATMAYLVEESRRVDAYQNPLLHRHDLSADLASRMYGWVSAALREHIVKRYDIDPALLDAQLGAAVEKVAREGRKPSRAGELARRLAQRQAIEPKLLTQSLREGKITLFESLFAELSQLPTALIRRFIYEEGGRSLATVCKALKIGKADFASIFLLSRGARPGDKSVASNEVAESLAFFDRMKPATAQKVLERWRRDPDFVLPDRPRAAPTPPGQSGTDETPPQPRDVVRPSRRGAPKKPL